MRRVLFHILLVVVLGILGPTACGNGRSIPSTYNGVPLPKPQFAPELPPVWLVINDQAVASSSGSFTITRKVGNGNALTSHGDAPPPHTRPDLATATIPPNVPLTIIVGTTPVAQVQARLAPWTDEFIPLVDPSVSHILRTEQQQAAEGNITVVTLAPLADPTNKLLFISLSFDNGEADYYWRINPIK